MSGRCVVPAMADPNGRDRLVRRSHGPERLVQTGIGPVAVQRVRLRDRGAGDDGERIRFTSAIRPRWARRARSLDALLPKRWAKQSQAGTPSAANAGAGRPIQTHGPSPPLWAIPPVPSRPSGERNGQRLKGRDTAAGAGRRGLLLRYPR